VETLKRDYRRLDLEPAERAMLDYAAVLTAAPWRTTESHVQTLRAAGWDDRAILGINQICAYRNMFSRTTTGLGVVETVGDFDRDYEADAAAFRKQIIAGEAT
jgi:alkylhydroperoxidase family enzyme